MGKIADKARRLLFGNHPGDKLDDTPIELPAGHHKQPKSIAQEIQEQIAIQIAMKQVKDNDELQTIGEIEAELEDLENEDFKPTAGIPEYDYIEMDSEEYEPYPDSDSSPSEDEGVSTDEVTQDE